MILSVINNKGGTGKTTTAVNLSAALAEKGRKVLLCDLDCQASASLSMGIPYSQLIPGMAELLFDSAPYGRCIRSTGSRSLDIISGGPALASADLILADVPGRESVLSRALDELRNYYDIIILDCAPSLSLLQVNAFTACDSYLIPLTPEYLALEGLISLLDAAARITEGMGINPGLLGILFTMVNPWRFNFLSRELREQNAIMELVRAQYDHKVFETVIRRDLSLAEAPSHGQTIFDYAPHGKSAAEFISLADEVLQGMEKR